MNLDKFFFSPQPTPDTTNKYTYHFFETLSSRVWVVNNKKRPISRSVDILRYSFNSNHMILNWPEDVIHLKLGIMQMFISFFSLLFFRLKGGIIIWVCHNKESHVKKLRWLSRLNRVFYTRMARYIIVHSEDAMHHFPDVQHKVFYLNHPVYNRLTVDTAVNTAAIPPRETDVLIWGNITPYKGLTEFIQKYKLSNAFFHVTIVGKANKEYYGQLKELSKGLNITIQDQFLTDEELNSYFNKAKIILLPYLDSDTFSSGSLIHSLNSHKIVIGPSVGNFLDLQKYGACLVYKNHADLFEQIKSLLHNKTYYFEKLGELNAGIERYYKANSWDLFIDQLLSIVSEPKKLSSTQPANRILTKGPVQLKNF